MDHYREIYRILGFVIAETVNQYDQTAYHIRKPSGEIVSTEFATPSRPINIMMKIEAMDHDN